jgi:hypothetical protein
MDSRPWHVGYFADEGELYEWEEEEDPEEDPVEELDRDFGKDYGPDDWPDPEHFFRRPTSVTSIAATPYGLSVIASLIADMQRQLGHLPQSSKTGLKPIYAPNQVSEDLLGLVVASSESIVTQLEAQALARSRLQSRQEVSQGGLIQRALSAGWAHKTEIVLSVLGGGAVLYIVGRSGGAGIAAPALARMVGPMTALFIKIAQQARVEAEYEVKMANFDYLGQEVSEIGVI